jgi:hypothetical protein
MYGFDHVMGVNFTLLYTVEDLPMFDLKPRHLPFYHVIDI